MKGCEEQIVTEMARVRFAYQCLGPGALLKMRSSFRCLEDPSVPPEITTLTGFLDALKQRCQDPGLKQKATLAVEILYQKKTSFHDFITSFEDLMADSIYANQPKSQWKIMLRRRLSRKLQEALAMVHDVPTDYHPFVSYLRQKDAAFQEINASNIVPSSSRSMFSPFNHSTNPLPHVTPELTVSQGGSAMDLDTVSRQKGPDGRLTPQAKDARRSLGRCMWCNKPGHIAIDCHLNSHTVASATVEATPSSNIQLKDTL